MRIDPNDVQYMIWMFRVTISADGIGCFCERKDIERYLPALRAIGANATIIFVQRFLDERFPRPLGFMTKKGRHYERWTPEPDDAIDESAIHDIIESENLDQLLENYLRTLEPGFQEDVYEAFHATADAESSKRCAAVLAKSGLRFREMTQEESGRLTYVIEVHSADLARSAEVFAADLSPGQ